MATISGLINGINAVLMFYNGAFVPFVCSSNVSIAITGDKLPTKTIGDGQWAKNNYQNLSFSITLDGVLKFDDTDMTGWDLIANHVNFVQLQFQITFTDQQNANTRSVRGYCIVQTSQISYTPGDLVKESFDLQGTGALMIFDGTVPCDADITAINLTGQTASDGILHVAYTYTGVIAQIKYRIDATGPYLYVAGGVAFTIPGLSVGVQHQIEIIPICQNGFDGTGMTQLFTMTQSMSCSSVITAINVSGTGPVSFTVDWTGAATQMKYRVDGGPWIYTLLSSDISLRLAIGSHTIDAIPICANNIEGTGASQAFTVSSSATIATINYALNNTFPGAQLLIYKNGVQIVGINNTGTGSFVALSTDSINAVIAVLDDISHLETLLVVNNTTSTTLSNQSRMSTPASTSYLEYAFTPTGGNTYTITATQSP